MSNLLSQALARPAGLLPILVPVATTVLGLLAGIAVQRRALPRLARAVVLWLALLGLALGIQVTTPSPVARTIAQRVIAVLMIASVTWTLSRLAGELVRLRTAPLAGRGPSSNLLTNLVRSLVLTLGGLMLLDTMGLSITPLVTALGAGGIAVGLALQETLADLFAGVHILLSRQVRPGDFVRLSSGEEGYVEDVTWRYTTVRQLGNNLTIVPNTKLASAVTANFSLPDPEQAVLVEVGVSYDSDLNHVERVTVAVGREVMERVPGGVRNFAPFVRFHSFGESSIGCTVVLRAQDYVSQYLLRHEFIQRLHARYRAEGIEIPFPIRTLHWRPAPGLPAAPPRTPDPTEPTVAPRPQ